MIGLSQEERNFVARTLLATAAPRKDMHVHILYKSAVELVVGDMDLLAAMAVDTFDLTGHFPDVWPSIASTSSLANAEAFATKIKEIRDQRAKEGKGLLVEFVDEDGVSENVLFMANYQHLRKSAA